MSNWIDYDLDVLAGSPPEINQIAERLKQPSTELVAWAAGKFGQPVSEINEALKEMFEFKATRNLGSVDPITNRARRFSLSFKDRYHGIVDSHLFENLGRVSIIGILAHLPRPDVELRWKKGHTRRRGCAAGA